MLFESSGSDCPKTECLWVEVVVANSGGSQVELGQGRTTRHSSPQRNPEVEMKCAKVGHTGA